MFSIIAHLNFSYISFVVNTIFYILKCLFFFFLLFRKESLLNFCELSLENKEYDKVEVSRSFTQHFPNISETFKWQYHKLACFLNKSENFISRINVLFLSFNYYQNAG